jgi:HEAT repeat protein
MVAYWAAQALGRIGDPKAVPSLIRVLKSGYGPTYKIAEVLERFGTEEARRVVEAYRSVEMNPLAFALWSQYGMDPDEALKKIQRAQSNDDA